MLAIRFKRAAPFLRLPAVARTAMAHVFPWILAVLFHLGAAVLYELHDDVLTNITAASTDIEADWAQD